jgi:muconolactone D-isomerase
MTMLYFVDVRVDAKDLSLDELWDIWEKEAEAAASARDAGMIVSIYKIVGQRRVIVIMNAESHDQLDQIMMAALPMANYLVFDEIVPIRDYFDFAADVKRRWK